MNRGGARGVGVNIVPVPRLAAPANVIELCEHEEGTAMAGVEAFEKAQEGDGASLVTQALFARFGTESGG